jgi:hypothetical protein
MSYWKNKTAIITGGGFSALADGRCGSIGYGIATAYAKEGANLVITGRNVGKLEKAKETLEIYPMQHLYDSVNSIEQAYRDAEEKYGALLEKEEQYKDSLRTQKNTKRTTDNLSKEKESPSMPDHARTGHTIAGNKPARQKKSVLMRLAEKQESMKNTNRQRENIPSRSNRRKGGPEL